MCRIIVMLAVCGVLTAVTALSAQQPPDKSTLDRVNGLVEKLGSTKFTERERAMKELDDLGPSILPALRPAQKSADAEIRKRVELLIHKFEDLNLASSLLKGKRLRLNVKNASVPDAVAELARLSGYEVVLTSDAKTFAGFKLTLDTGETSFWQALDQLCEKADLVETSAKPGFPAKNNNAAAKAAINLVRVANSGTPTSTPLYLAAGKRVEMPTIYAGSVRIRLLKSVALPKGANELVFEVANEPRLSGFAPASNPAIEKAIDDQKQSVAAVVRPLPMFEKPAPAQANNGIGNFGIGNGVGNGILLNNAASATTGFAAFQFTVLVKPGENAVKKLQELTGKLKIQTIVDTEPLAVIDKIMEATGKTAQSKDGTTSVKIANIRKLANGDIAVQVSIGDTNGQNAGAAGAIQIQGGGNIQINGRNVIVAGVGGPASPASNIRLLDAKGQSFQHTQTTGSGISINNNQITYTQVLIFHPHEGQGEPAQLALFGQRAFAFDVPFTLKEIRLP